MERSFEVIVKTQYAIFFFAKAVFCEALSYGVLHLPSGGLILK